MIQLNGNYIVYLTSSVVLSKYGYRSMNRNSTIRHKTAQNDIKVKKQNYESFVLKNKKKEGYRIGKIKRKNFLYSTALTLCRV